MSDFANGFLSPEERSRLITIKNNFGTTEATNELLNLNGSVKGAFIILPDPNGFYDFMTALETDVPTGADIMAVLDKGVWGSSKISLAQVESLVKLAPEFPGEIG